MKREKGPGILTVARWSLVQHHVCSTAAVAGILVMLGVHLGVEAAGTSEASWLHHQTDITGHRNLAALFQAAFAIIGAILGLRAAISAGTVLVSGIWMILAGLMAIIAVTELLASSPPSQLVTVSIALLTLPFVAFMYRQTSHIRGALPLVVLMAMLIIASPVIDQVERRITSNPENYYYVGPGVPYAFSIDAWNQLRLVSTIQEVVEIGAVICLIALLEALMRFPRDDSQ